MRTTRGKVVLLALVVLAACKPRPDPITSQALIGISTEKVPFQHPVGIGHGASEQTVTIRNRGGGILMTPVITVGYLEKVGDWLRWELSGDVNNYQLTLRPQNPEAGPLPAGSYHATVEVDCSKGGTAVIEIDVQVVPKSMVASPIPLEVAAALGGKGWAQRLHVEEALRGDLSEPEYQLSLPAGLSWLKVGTPFQAWSSEDQTNYWDPDLRLDATGLSIGRYEATVTATSTDAGSVSVPVVLQVADWADVPTEPGLSCPLPLALADGRVLCADDPPRAFDPATGAWAELPASPSSLPVRLTALLPDGTVLFLHQNYACFPTCLEEAEWAVLDPVAEVWPATGSLPKAHGATATPLADGRVLLTGHIMATPGRSTPSRLSALLDPAAGTLVETTSLLAPHQYAAAVRLRDGRVLIAGGMSDDGFETRAELFQPSTTPGETGTWTATGAMGVARAGFSLVQLASGRVLAAGGFGADGALSSAEVYDPATGKWSRVGSMISRRCDAGSPLTLPDGTILITGGMDTSGADSSRWPISQAERYDPVSQTWSPWADLPSPRYGHWTSLLDGTFVLVLGGTAISPAPGSVRRVTYP